MFLKNPLPLKCNALNTIHIKNPSPPAICKANPFHPRSNSSATLHWFKSIKDFKDYIKFLQSVFLKNPLPSKCNALNTIHFKNPSPPALCVSKPVSSAFQFKRNAHWFKSIKDFKNFFNLCSKTWNLNSFPLAFDKLRMTIVSIYFFKISPI